MNDAKGDPESDPNVATHTIDRKKRKVTDTSNGYLKQKILSNQITLIITTTIDPRIDNRVATSGSSTLKLETPQTTKFITDAACINTHVLRNPGHVIRTGRNGTTSGNTPHYVSPPLSKHASSNWMYHHLLNLWYHGYPVDFQ